MKKIKVSMLVLFFISWIWGCSQPITTSVMQISDHAEPHSTMASKLKADHGWYTVPGLGSRKRAILNNGGNTLDMAIAMLETDNMQADYQYGDGKKYDAANFGIFKQNWLMIRTSVPQYADAGPQEYDWGKVLNTNLSWDIQVLHASQQKYGLNWTWWAGHRAGQSGIEGNWPAQDIINYRDAVLSIKDWLDNNPHCQTNDTRMWVQVPPV